MLKICQLCHILTFYKPGPGFGFLGRSGGVCGLLGLFGLSGVLGGLGGGVTTGGRSCGGRFWAAPFKRDWNAASFTFCSFCSI